MISGQPAAPPRGGRLIVLVFVFGICAAVHGEAQPLCVCAQGPNPICCLDGQGNSQCNPAGSTCCGNLGGACSAGETCCIHPDGTGSCIGSNAGECCGVGHCAPGQQCCTGGCIAGDDVCCTPPDSTVGRGYCPAGYTCGINCGDVSCGPSGQCLPPNSSSSSSGCRVSDRRVESIGYWSLAYLVTPTLLLWWRRKSVARRARATGDLGVASGTRRDPLVEY
jgi:hypothetical protein